MDDRAGVPQRRPEGFPLKFQIQNFKLKMKKTRPPSLVLNFSFEI
jgi:hypothetical protein